MAEMSTYNKNIKRVPLSKLPLTDEVKIKLYKWRDRELKGQNIDYRTPLYATKAGSSSVIPKRSRISGVDKLVPPIRAELVEKFYHDVISSSIKHPDYRAWEDKFFEYRFSPRSVKLPYNMIAEKAIYPYFTNATKSVSPDVKVALEMGLKDWVKKLDKTIPPKSLRALSFEEASENIPSTTNWGAPYFKQGKVMDGDKVKEDNRHLYIKEAKRLSVNNVTELDRFKNAFWSIWRGQESNDYKDKWEGVVKPKQRRPWAEGHAWTIIGARMKPFLDIRAKNPTRAALVNQAEVDKVIESYWPRVSGNTWIVSWDGSSYDTHMMPWLAEQIGGAIVDRFNCSEQDRRSFIAYFNHVFTDPLITPEGLLVGLHGMPSGTTFTNELDSCYNEVLVESFKYLPSQVTNGVKVELETVTDQGDDMVLLFHILSNQSSIHEDEIKEILSKGYEAMNMAVNPNKQMVSHNKCEYLKRLHIKGTRESYRSYVWTVIGMLNMEHAKDWKMAMYSSRWVMQASNHYGNLEGFDQFMNWIANGDNEYHLGVGIEGGAMKILQMAGGENSVIKRLGYAAYTTHLGVDVKGSRATIADLSAARWVAAKNAEINHATRKTERGPK